MYQKRPRATVDPFALQQNMPDSFVSGQASAKGGCDTCNPCATLRYERDCRPKHIRSKYEVTNATVGTCFPRSSCRANLSSCKLSELEAWVRPRGTLTWLLSYEAFDYNDNGDICFRWDDNLFGLKTNRLEVEFRECGKPCGVVELRIRTNCMLDTRQAVHITRNPYCDPVAPPGGITDVFADIVGFSGALCAVLEAGSTVMKICGPQRAQLCAIQLCRPVELVLDDGVNHELVEFAGCTGNDILIIRGSGGTTPRKFPVGTRVRFSWTPANVLAAQEGCP